MAIKKPEKRLKKLIIQIPCYNEAQSLPTTLSQLPRSLPGIDSVQWLIIDDGSSDDTIQVAKDNGVDHVVCLQKHRGLATAFMAGIRECIRLGADIIVNTDADNQYRAEDISGLISPILETRAEMVVGARPIDSIQEFSVVKKIFQKLGSLTVRIASGTDIPDAPSGFRAISRNAAKQLNVFSRYSYTLETIIQAGQKGIPITWVPVRTNPTLRPSRLVKNSWSYIYLSTITIVRIFVVYKPFRFFSLLGLIFFLVGGLISLRFLFYYLSGEGRGHVQSLILASILIGMGFQTFIVALIADLLSVNRRLLEFLQFKAWDKNSDDTSLKN